MNDQGVIGSLGAVPAICDSATAQSQIYRRRPLGTERGRSLGICDCALAESQIAGTAPIDILLAVKNGELFLEEQLTSLFRQSYSHFHLIIRDNASTDSTPDILKQWQERYPDKITFIAGEKDLGIVGNFSTLLGLSTAPYVMFCDADDVWLEDKVLVTLEAMRKAEIEFGVTKPLLVHTDLIVVDRELQTLHPSFWKMSHKGAGDQVSFSKALTENGVTGCTVMINRSLADLSSPIPFDVPMHDAWLGVVAAAFGAVIPLHRATMLYRQHGNNAAGAGKYSWWNFSAKVRDPVQRKKIETIRLLRLRQAEYLLKKFENRLGDHQKEVIEVYLSLPKASWIERLRRLSNHNLFETGLLRKIYQVFNP